MINDIKRAERIYPRSTETLPQSLLIKNGRVIDPAVGIDEVLCVAVDKGKIVSVSRETPADFKADTVIDATGLWVCPGLVDLHVHLREPGREDKETIETGARAAAAGGFTAVACMPNTSPVLDDPARIRFVRERARGCSCRVYPVGSITRNLDGIEITPFSSMIDDGARGFSDDGKSVGRTDIMRDAFVLARSLGVPLLSHCEDPHLARNGHLNEGSVSRRLGVRGIPSVAEDIIVARDIMLAEYTGAQVHICHVSTARAVHLIRCAKKRGVAVSAETCPHYFVFTEEDAGTLDTHKKMNPPLRTAVDRKALLQAVAEGTIDCIATDHAPHTAVEKAQPFDKAPFGVIGLETALAASLTNLVHPGIISPADLVMRMSVAPNRVIKTTGGTLCKGCVADITIIDPDSVWSVDPSQFYSKGRNCAFDGMKLKGMARWTIVGGTIVFEKNPL